VSDLAWYFPESLENVPDLLQKDGVIPHAGGTGLTAVRLRRIKGLIDLRRLPLTFFRNAGATTDGASTPLRNRITLGGSVAYYPMWSDLMGPLVALEAELSLFGAGELRVPLAEYLRKPELKQNHLITTVHLKGMDRKAPHWRAFYHREARTKTDYPAFTLTILLRNDEGGQLDARIVLSGVKGKYSRQERLEESIRERGIDAVGEAIVDDGLDAEFTARRLGSPEYLRHLAVIAICRGLLRLGSTP
jgi:CO/xanthine dehydrogenase FAD-binding subunit